MSASQRAPEIRAAVPAVPRGAVDEPTRRWWRKAHALRLPNSSVLMPPSEYALAYLSVGDPRAGAEHRSAQNDAMARAAAEVRERGGRLFIPDVGGGAGHASHAVNDFRKLCGRGTLRAHGHRVRALDQGRACRRTSLRLKPVCRQCVVQV